MDVITRTVETTRFLSEAPVWRARTGQTPHEIVFRQNKSVVRYFAPEEATQTPLFVSMPLINTWTIWDLLPERSVIQKLLAAGFPVYVLDWGRPGPEDADRPMIDYVDGVLGRALARVKRHAGQPVDAVGYCVGGTFLAVHLARHPDSVGKVAFVCTPIDFHKSGRLHLWADPETFPLDDIVDNLGNFPLDLMATSFSWLRPANMTRKWFGLWERIDSDAFKEIWAALEQWNSDSVDFPGECYREYVRRCYFDNALVTGGWQLGNAPVDLSRCSIPALSVAASSDHIVPPPAAHALEAAWGGDVETVTLKGGHVAVSITDKLPTTLIGWFADGDAA